MASITRPTNWKLGTPIRVSASAVGTSIETAGTASLLGQKRANSSWTQKSELYLGEHGWAGRRAFTFEHCFECIWHRIDKLQLLYDRPRKVTPDRTQIRFQKGCVKLATTRCRSARGLLAISETFRGSANFLPFLTLPQIRTYILAREVHFCYSL